MSAFSIRRRLLAGQIGALMLTVVLVTIVTYTIAWDSFNRLRDDALHQMAEAVLRHGETSLLTLGVTTEAGQFVGQVWGPDGTLRFTSSPEMHLPLQESGLAILQFAGQEWHVMTTADATKTVQVASTSANRTRMFQEIVPWLFLPGVMLVFVLGGFIMMSVNSALNPLAELRNEIGSRDPANIRPLSTRAYPEELQPPIDALNQLLARLDHALDVQRRFVADAAHELRTPLAAIRLQAQIARREADDPVARDEAYGRLLAGVERGTHLVEQLLRLARFDPGLNQVADREDVDLVALAGTLVGEFSDRAEALDVDLGLGDATPVRVAAEPEALRVLLGNLIDNALRHAASGRRIDVHVRVQDELAELWVVDYGPGIPADARTQVFERFHRLAGPEVLGSGLGLAIVREIVTRLAGRIRLLETPGGGLSVCVELPRLPLST